MNIAIDGNEANVKNRVGVNQYASELLCALEKLPQAREHQWTVFLKDKPLPNLPGPRKGWEYKILPGGSLWVVRQLTPALWKREAKQDVLFTPSHYTPPLLPFPMVMSVMDLGYLHFPNQFRKRDFYQLKYWGAWSMGRAKKIIAISESTKKDIANYYPWAYNKTAVTYLGYNKEMFYHPFPISSIEKVKKKYKISGEYILFLSTLKPSKNIEGLFEAFQALLGSGGKGIETMNLVIAGKKGWLFDSIFTKVKELGLENFVTFTDFVSEEEKPALLAGAKVFVLPSFWEGFGMPVLESMAVGTPVVVSDVASLPEIVGDSGILVNPKSPHSIAEGIRRVVSLPQNKYNELAKKGICQAQKFDWEKTAKKTLQILEEV